ncbi:tetratricopeptide repeat-containing diguanylate cyclase [Proteocatella sphenisci]|uniref:tetratricopeptide repeat-containing diguanylate cyclase n=1 Tax=Proteocatella sphenisci TaxID=181070 RepID=UPI000491367A|nr:GGDEF domain-containing protein [Proteocatella sphenisci]
MNSTVDFEFERDFELLAQNENHIEEIVENLKDNILRDIDKAGEIIDKLLSITSKNKMHMAGARAKYLSSIYFTEKMEYEKSIQYAKEAYEYFIKTDNTIALIEICNEIMLAHLMIEKYIDAIHWGNFTMEICEKNQEYKHSFMAGINLAFAYEKLGEYTEASEMYKRLESLESEAKQIHKLGLYINRAHNEASLNNTKEVERLLEKCYKIAEKEDHNWDLPEMIFIKGCIYLKRCQYYLAEEAFKRAIEESHRTGNLSFISDIYIQWGELYIKKYRYEEAKDKFFAAKQALSGRLSEGKLLKIYTGLAKAEKNQNNYRQSLEYFKLAQEFSDSLIQKNSHIYIAGMKIKQTERHTRFVKNQTREIKELAEIGKVVMTGISREDIVRTVTHELCKYLVADDLEVEFDENKEQLPLKRTMIHKSVMSERVLAGEKYLGMLRVKSSKEKAFGSSEYKKLRIIASYMGIAIENSKFIESARYAADYDYLTGLFTREKIMNIGQTACSEFLMSPGSRRLCIAMADIDHFKKINDSYGHSNGDAVIVESAKILKEKFGEKTFSSRYGGEEFLVVLPDLPLAEAVELTEKARQAIQDSYVSSEDKRQIRFTASFGVFEFTPDISNLDEGIRKVDSMLYRAKQNGRNRVDYYGNL